VFAGYPNASVIQAAASNDVVMIDVVAATEGTGFFEDYPFYTPVTIPAGTYSGVDHDVRSFEDAALWVVGKHVDAGIVARSLAEIFSREGLAYMVKVKSTARAMSVEGALHGIVTPIHPGAETFWKSHGLEPTEAQTAR
jgi:TRAP transporter TAXI family solute receptor